jgi:hypothetical protein
MNIHLVSCIKNYALHIVFLGLICFSSHNLFAQDIPPIKKGILDLRNWNFVENEAINIGGQWEFYWQEYLNTSALNSPSHKKIYRQFPKLWRNDTVNGQIISPIGYATHRLKIVLSSITPELSISIPEMYNSYFLFINGEFIASSGQIGTSKENSFPHWRTLTKDLKVTSDTLDIVLQISNFHHSKGGSAKAISLGTKDFLQSVNKRTQAYDLIMASS